MNCKTLSILSANLFAALLLCGCTTVAGPNYSNLNLIPVRGTITLDGSPLSGAVVVFEDADTQKISYAKTDSSGSYKLHFDTSAMGTIAGRKTVQVSMTRKIMGLDGGEEEAVSEEGPAQPKPLKDTIPACYNADSKLTVTVDGSSSTFNFDLKSDCSTTGPS